MVPTLPTIATIKYSCAMFLLEMGAKAILKSKCPQCNHSDTDDDDDRSDHTCTMPEDKTDLNEGGCLKELN